MIEHHYLSNMNEQQNQNQSYANEAVNDTNDQECSYPEMGTPERSAETGTKMYNHDYNYDYDE